MKGRSGQTLSAVGFSAVVALAGTKQERWILICPAFDENKKRRERHHSSNGRGLRLSLLTLKPSLSWFWDVG